MIGPVLASLIRRRRRMQDAVGELGAQLAEVRATHAHAIAWRALTWVGAAILWQVRDGLRTCEAAEQTDSQGAQATIVTLEDRTIVLRMDSSGVRDVTDGGASSFAYESVNTFLINESPGYVKHFNSSLAAALAKVSQEREAEERAREAAGGTGS